MLWSKTTETETFHPAELTRQCGRFRRGTSSSTGLFFSRKNITWVFIRLSGLPKPALLCDRFVPKGGIKRSEIIQYLNLPALLRTSYNASQYDSRTHVHHNLMFQRAVQKGNTHGEGCGSDGTDSQTLGRELNHAVFSRAEWWGVILK